MQCNYETSERDSRMHSTVGAHDAFACMLAAVQHICGLQTAERRRLGPSSRTNRALLDAARTLNTIAIGLCMGHSITTARALKSSLSATIDGNGAGSRQKRFSGLRNGFPPMPKLLAPSKPPRQCNTSCAWSHCVRSLIAMGGITHRRGSPP